MSSSYVVSNNGISTLAAAISSSSQTSITVTSGHGARFPSPTGGDYTLVTLENAAGTIEIVSIVGRSTDVLTVGIAGSAAANAAGRGMESTTATTWSIADIIEGRATAAVITKAGNAVTKTSATGSVVASAGTTAQRDGAPAAGYFRYNSTLVSFEGYNGSAWGSVGGGATGGSTDHVFYENDQTVTVDYTITSGKNAGTFGPVTINTGVVVTIGTGSVWTIC